MDRIMLFMEVYMYELEKFLSSIKDELKTIPFQSDEANTDRPLKEFLKQKIENDFNCIPHDTPLQTLILSSGEIIDIEPLKQIKIDRVLLPEEITDNIKNKLFANITSVRTNPDICFELKTENHFHYVKVELKSTKNDSIPGSSIQQISLYEWVIFVKHTNTQINISTGKYINAINSKMQFPDRSPRPQVSFSTIAEWNNNHRIVDNTTLSYTIDTEESNKTRLIFDWQQELANRWIYILFESKSVKNNEPWFNNALRKFIISFLNKYDKLTENEKSSFKSKISSLIIGNEETE